MCVWGGGGEVDGSLGGVWRGATSEVYLLANLLKNPPIMPLSVFSCF